MQKDERENTLPSANRAQEKAFSSSQSGRQLILKGKYMLPVLSIIENLLMSLKEPLGSAVYVASVECDFMPFTEEGIVGKDIKVG
jgi:hypothetical protein